MAVSLSDAPELAGAQLVADTITDEQLAALAAHDRRAAQGTDPKFPGRPERTCTSKRAYGERAAWRAARVLRDAQGEAVHAYSCPYCRRWHVGHEPYVRPTS